MAMSEADMEQYAQLLDDLCEKDPQAYEQFMQMMREQVAAAAASGGGGEGGGAAMGGVPRSAPPDAASMLELIKNASSGKSAGVGADSGTSDSFKPQFPGNKVMETSGLTAKQEGIYIDVEPGFVMKTTDLQKKQKVFVNICHASAIQTFSQRKQLDDTGVEQEGVHVPLSLGAPHEVEDKSGRKSIAFDVAVNTQVVEDCKSDKTGAFRNFVCELAIEYIDQKYKIQLDARYKLPKLAYRGVLPPPKHYIRKTQTPIIEDVTSSASPSSTSQPSSRTKKDKPKKAIQAELVAAQYELFEMNKNTSAKDARVSCSRVAAVEATGTALSKEMLLQAGSHLAVRITFKALVAEPDELEIELRAEHLTVKAQGHHDLAFYLPFPVKVEDAEVTLDRSFNALELVVPIDKTWVESQPDCGSTPWLLAQALHDDEPSSSSAATEPPSPAPPKSLVEMFHLAMPPPPVAVDSHQPSSSQATGPGATRRAQWDPVDDDEELPEDRFHRKDMMSMHILEQRKKEKQQKANEADAKRNLKRADVQEKQRLAKKAGKTWQEMYPHEPETTYIDMDEILQNQQAKMATTGKKQVEEPPLLMVAAEASETAKRMAATWCEEKKPHGLDLQSALAFDLLD